MASREVLKRIAKLSCEVTRRRGSHHRVECPGGCKTTVPVHGGDIPKGTLRAIERDLEPCLGPKWLTK